MILSNFPPAKYTHWNIPPYFTLSGPLQHECLGSLVRSNMLCFGRAKKVGKLKSERLGIVQAGALHAPGERWFSA